MISDKIEVSGREDRIALALRQAEKVAEYRKLSAGGAGTLRLLSEEMLNMLRAVVGEAAGVFWIESEGEQYELHLKVKARTDEVSRGQLLSAATSGVNEADRGFWGKLRAFFVPIEGVPVFFDMNPDGSLSDTTWSMRAYQLQIQQYIQQNRAGAREAWDELEKTVIAHVADDVKVSIRGSDVEMTVFKKLV